MRETKGLTVEEAALVYESVNPRDVLDLAEEATAQGQEQVADKDANKGSIEAIEHLEAGGAQTGRR